MFKRCILFALMLCLIAAQALATDYNVTCTVFRSAEWSDSTYQPGMYRVNIDIPAGTYIMHAMPGESCGVDIGHMLDLLQNIDTSAAGYRRVDLAAPGSPKYSASIMPIHKTVELSAGDYLHADGPFMLLPPSSLPQAFTTDWQAAGNPPFDYDAFVSSSGVSQGDMGVIGGTVVFSYTEDNTKCYLIATSTENGAHGDYVVVGFLNEHLSFSPYNGDNVEFLYYYLDNYEDEFDSNPVVWPTFVGLDLRLIQ